MSDKLSSTVISAVVCLTQARQQPSEWDRVPLTTTHPALRMVIDGRSWIIKKSHDDHKDVVLSMLFDEYGVTHHHARCAGEQWVLMRDAGRHTLESMPRELYRPKLFSQLGRLAASALLVGMRDRKLGNIAVDAEETSRELILSHIDYEGAFRTGLVNRILRPQKYYRYLLTRLLFDVATRFGEHDHQAVFSLFLGAFREEWGRLGQLRPSRQLLEKMRIRERMILKSGRWNVGQACRLMQEAFDDLIHSQAN